jgi:hypothetical protein
LTQESEQSDLKTSLHAEIKDAYAINDEWLIITLETSDKDKVYLSPDTVFCGTEKSRELRGPRWRSLKSAKEFESIGYNYIIAGKLGMTVLAKLIKDKNIPKGIVVHKATVEKWLPSVAKVNPTLNSVQGYVNPKNPANKSIAAKRPGSSRRKKIKQGKTCYYCSSDINLTLHHLVRRQFGGATEEENLLVVCRDCHDKIHTGIINDIALVLDVHCKRVNNLINKITNDEEII